MLTNEIVEKQLQDLLKTDKLTSTEQRDPKNVFKIFRKFEKIK